MASKYFLFEKNNIFIAFLLQLCRPIKNVIGYRIGSERQEVIGYRYWWEKIVIVHPYMKPQNVLLVDVNLRLTYVELLQRTKVENTSPIHGKT